MGVLEDMIADMMNQKRYRTFKAGRLEIEEVREREIVKIRYINGFGRMSTLERSIHSLFKLLVKD